VSAEILRAHDAAAFAEGPQAVRIGGAEKADQGAADGRLYGRCRCMGDHSREPARQRDVCATILNQIRHSPSLRSQYSELEAEG